jgi:hypothetical protein
LNLTSGIVQSVPLISLRVMSDASQRRVADNVMKRT